MTYGCIENDALMVEQDKRITETLSRERARLRNFIRRRVADPGDAEDILQDVFYSFVEAYRLPDPIEQAGAWLYRVARNRIIDRFRKKKSEPLVDAFSETDDEPWLEAVLPSSDAGPEAAYARKVLLDEIYAALDGLPEQQRAVFIAHELEGRSVKALAARRPLERDQRLVARAVFILSLSRLRCHIAMHLRHLQVFVGHRFVFFDKVVAVPDQRSPFLAVPCLLVLNSHFPVLVRLSLSRLRFLLVIGGDFIVIRLRFGCLDLNDHHRRLRSHGASAN